MWWSGLLIYREPSLWSKLIQPRHTSTPPRFKLYLIHTCVPRNDLWMFRTNWTKWHSNKQSNKWSPSVPLISYLSTSLFPNYITYIYLYTIPTNNERLEIRTPKEKWPLTLLPYGWGNQKSAMVCSMKSRTFLSLNRQLRNSQGSPNRVKLRTVQL